MANRKADGFSIIGGQGIMGAVSGRIGRWVRLINFRSLCL